MRGGWTKRKGWTKKRIKIFQRRDSIRRIPPSAMIASLELNMDAEVFVTKELHVSGVEWKRHRRK